MHIRIRNNVAQLIRTVYDKDSKKGKNTTIGSVRLAKPELTDALRALLTADEIEQFETWKQTARRATTLQEELAALTLADRIAEAARWFNQHGDSEAARTAANDILTHWHSLRRALKKNGLID